MKIEKINESKIKITISLNDLEERNIDLNSLSYNSPAAQELFWDMMEEAEVRFGFNVSDSQLCVEACPSSNEGFIVTITRLDGGGDFDPINRYLRSRFKRTELRAKRKSKKVSSPVVIYSFNNFEDLCALVKELEPMYTGDSSLHKYDNLYYITLSKENWDASDSMMFENILNEYGIKVSNVFMFEGFLNEYGVKISEYNALEVINKYF